VLIGTNNAAPTGQHVAFLGGPGVTYEERLPPTPLRPWIAVLWRIRAEVRFELLIPPDGCMDVIGGDVIGSFSRPDSAILEPRGVYEGIRFHPGGFPALSGVPASELLDLRVPLGELVPGFTSLGRLAVDAPPPDPLAAAAIGARSVAQLARESGYSERQVRRRLLTATGHGPKRLMRIARMQRTLLGGKRGNWARTAAEQGFADEAHMANDFRALVGATPHALIG
jgi:AraC-like DNA-binding protein